LACYVVWFANTFTSLLMCKSWPKNMSAMIEQMRITPLAPCLEFRDAQSQQHQHHPRPLEICAFVTFGLPTPLCQG
jgi:hypothetical protein